jgi:glyoxylase-like metal-dependent hydrolase (beta-lactamase superfamily II)
MSGSRAWAQAPAAQAPPTTRFDELRRGVGVFVGNGGTIGYLVNADGAVAVDSQFMNTAEICVAALKSRAPKGIAMLINTHHHGDHTGGNVAFKGSVQTIVAHENCAAWHKKTSAAAAKPTPQAFADTTFGDAWKSDFGDETIHAKYFGAGHTSGDAIITFEKANVVHMGDLLFNRAHPNIDRAAGARIDSWIRVLEIAVANAAADTIFIAGHAKDNAVRNTRADVIHFRNYLAAGLDHARAGAKAGHSKEEVQKLAALKGFEDTVSINARLSMAFVLGLCYDEVMHR